MRTHDCGRAGACCLLAVAMTLSGCATPRPDPGLACNLYARTTRALPPPPPPTGSETQATRTVQAKASDATLRASSLQAQIEQSYKDRQAVKRDRRPLKLPPVPVPPGQPAPPPPAPSYDVLVLSAGGQFGAYGSGFLKGWGDRADLQPNRPDIDMITGVSTGAMMAAYVYLGSSDEPAVRAKYDALLKDQYTTLRNDDVIRVRSAVELLWSNSVYDSTPLRTRISALITDDLLTDLVAEAERSRRLLFVGAVNADSGLFEHFDLIAIARDRSHDRRACFSAAILASAAIPVVFNPVFINGQMYIDGGARQHAFFLAQAAAVMPSATKTLYGILHGDLRVQEQQTKNHLIGVVTRTSSIATDQLLLDSAYYVDAEAARLGYRTRWTAAANTNCPGGADDDMFSPAAGLCLWNAGHARARDDPNPWKRLPDVGVR